MTKYAMTSNTSMYPHPHVFSMSGPNKDGILIRQVDATHAYICWDDETPGVMDGFPYIEIELCELDNE